MADFWFALWFFAPAGAANVMPIFLAKISGLRRLNAPVDCGLTLKNKRIFGDHKTWRGLIGGVITAILITWLQEGLFQHYGWAKNISMQVNYNSISIITLGFLLGFGVLAGDMAKSFVKRQINIEPGHSWFPLDQLDYIIGGLLLSSIVIQLTLTQYVWIIITWFTIHLISSYIGFRFKLKSSPI